MILPCLGISWILYNLAAHPEYQARARAEVLDVTGDSDVISWNDVGKLEYLTMCVKESLRTHPPVPNIGRITTKPLTFKDGRTVPAGASHAKTLEIHRFLKSA